jgi:hypothetical protein
LVGTGSALRATAYAIELADDLFGFESLYHPADALRVAVATAMEIAMRYAPLVVEGYIDELAAGAVGLIQYLTRLPALLVGIPGIHQIGCYSSGFMLV